MTTKVEPTVEKWELREKLADIEHQRWSDWQRYVHSKCVNHSNGKGELVCFPSELFRQWERQINTPYSELSEKEKDSDREQVDRYLPLLSHSLQEAKAEIARQLKMTLLIYQKELDGYPQDPNYVIPLEERIRAFIRHELSTLNTKASLKQEEESK